MTKSKKDTFINFRVWVNSLFCEINFRKLAKNSGQIFCINGTKKTGGPWKGPWKNEKDETEIATRNTVKTLNDE